MQKRDPRAEQWNGKRLGVEGAKKDLGFTAAYNGIDFVKSKIDFKKFAKVFIDGKFKDDHRNSSNNADIFDLTKSFKQKVGYNPSIFLSPLKKYFYGLVQKTTPEKRAETVAVIKKYQEQYQELKKDKYIQDYINTSDEKKRPGDCFLYFIAWFWTFNQMPGDY